MSHLRLHSARGFTFVEMLVSIAITSVIMVAIGSTLVVASRAIPAQDDDATAHRDAAQTLRRLVHEISYAESFVERTNRTCEFTVADRDGDGQTETMRYEWSGSPGAPLLHTTTTGQVVTLVDAVKWFGLDWTARAQSEVAGTGDPESAEAMLGNVTGGTAGSTVDVDDWFGQHIVPSLPADAVSWSVTRVLLKLRNASATDGTVIVQIRPAVNGLPHETVLEQQSMAEADLTSAYIWREFQFTSVTDLNPAASVCIVIGSADGAEAARVRWKEPGSGRLHSSDGGTNWSEHTTRELVYYLYGTYSTPGTGGPEEKSFVTRVQAGLLRGADINDTLVTSTRLLNEIEVTP